MPLFRHVLQRPSCISHIPCLAHSLCSKRHWIILGAPAVRRLLLPSLTRRALSTRRAPLQTLRLLLAPAGRGKMRQLLLLPDRQSCDATCDGQPEGASSLDCEDESAAGKDDGRSLNALARAQLGHTWAKVGLCAVGPSNVPTLPITPPTSLPAVAPPAIPLSKEMEGSSSQAKQQRSSGSGGREGDIESGRRSARQSRERARGRPRAAVWERESEEQQQPSASRGASGEDPETAALRQS